MFLRRILRGVVTMVMVSSVVLLLQRRLNNNKTSMDITDRTGSYNSEAHRNNILY